MILNLLRAFRRPQYLRTTQHSYHVFYLEPLEPRMMLSLTVPAHSSLPGADHTILLDFDGHVTEGTTWNSSYGVTTIVSPAYSSDSDANNFSSSELTLISNVWKRVAEDFSPFNVNVTTVDPGSDALRYTGGSDTQWGVRVVITKDTFANCGCGGHAYIGSFADFYDEPVFVYNGGELGVSEASSHEVGHALLLSHDGTSSSAYYQGHGSGDTSWAPLMGVSYNRNVSQWSKGEYYGANNAGSNANYGNGPDDLAIITSLTNGNGFGYRADDHSDANAGATSLTTSGTSVSGSGIIERTSDVDVFSFTTGTGNVALNINPAALGANLDVRARLYDANNNLLATSSPASTLNASFNLSLSQGQYHVQIDGVGTGSPLSSSPSGYTEYGSLGQYSISGTIVDPGETPQLSIDDVTVNEGVGTATFTVSLSGSISQSITVNVATSNGTAIAGSSSDYIANSGTLTFDPNGVTVQTFNVLVNDDSITESPETFFVNLSNASAGVIIADGQGQGTINDNDTDISINDVSGNEGNLAKGKKNVGNPTYRDFVFTISLSNAVGHSVSVDYATVEVPGSATPDVDYESTSGSVVFNAGQTSQTVTVRVIGDNETGEGDETFTVQLSNALGGNLADFEGTGEIVDDDTGGGGGRGNGKGKSALAAPREDATIEIQDALWMFEGPDHTETDHQHGDHLPVEPVSAEPTLTIAGLVYFSDLPTPQDRAESVFGREPWSTGGMSLDSVFMPPSQTFDAQPRASNVIHFAVRHFFGDDTDRTEELANFPDSGLSVVSLMGAFDQIDSTMIN